MQKTQPTDVSNVKNLPQSVDTQVIKILRNQPASSQKKDTEMNYSQTKRLALQLFGPLARVFHRNAPGDTHVEVGVDHGLGNVVVFGSGPTFQQAMKSAIVNKFKLESENAN